MTYYELIKLYKSGNLDNEQMKKVEKDIERQKAISEYLFDEDEIPAFNEIYETENIDFESLSDDSKNADNDGEKNFVNMIRSSIRRAFIKMGITVGTILLAIILFVMFLLPQVVNGFYYNPAEIVGEENGIETNRISLDMAVYTEMFLPGKHREQVIVEENGYGNYDVNVLQTFSTTGTLKNVSGKIEQGKLKLYDANLMNLPASNYFVPSEVGITSHIGMVGASGDRETAIELLNDLSNDDCYMAYITMSDVMTYSEFAKWCEKFNVYPDWCAICLKNDDGYYINNISENIGFIYSGSCSALYYDNETYPYLSQFDMCLTADNLDAPYDEKIMTTHVKSMLKYMDEQKEFYKMVGLSDTPDFKSIAENIDNYGLNIYGFTVIAQKDTLIELSNTENVYYISFS